MNNPLVTVIIPTYNREDLIGNALESTISQTYDNLEIIVVDDNSCDKTENVIKKYIEMDTRVKYIKHKKNLGGGASRNTGIKNSKGEYIAFLDSDDVWRLDKIEKQLECFRRNQSLIAVFCNYEMVQFETGKLLGNNNKALKCENSDIYVGNYLGTTSCLMAKRTKLFDIGMFDIELRSCQDWDVYIKLVNSGKIAYVPEILLTQYYHGKRMSNDGTNVLQGQNRLIEKMPKYLREANISTNEQSKIMSRLYYRLGMHYVNYNKLKESKEALKESLKYNKINWRNVKLIIKLYL